MFFNRYPKSELWIFSSSTISDLYYQSPLTKYEYSFYWAL